LLQDLAKEKKISEPEPPKVTLQDHKDLGTKGTEIKEPDQGNKPETRRALKRASTVIHGECTKPNKDIKVETPTAPAPAPNADVVGLMACEASWWGGVQPQKQSLVTDYWKF